MKRASVLALLLAGCSAASPAPPPRPSALFPAGDAARGQALGQTCMACHGADAMAADDGGINAARLHHQRRSAIFNALQDYRAGRRRNAFMEPVAQGLSDQDMRDVAAWLGGDMFDVPPHARTDMAIYPRTLRECATCHGETGIGELEGMPVLTGQAPAYLAAALSAYRSGARTEPTMRAIAKGIAPQDDAAFAGYYASHGWLEGNR